MTDQHQKKQQAGSSTLQLTVPALDTIENPNIETNPDRLIEWVSNLPHANPVSAATKLYRSIFQLNRFPGKISHRYKLVNCYQPSFAVIYQAARMATQQKSAQAGSKQTDVNLITIKISIELAYSYKSIINEHLQLNNICKHQQQFGNAIYFAIKAITAELMLEYSNLIPDSKKAWRELFQLYTLAEQYGLENNIIEKNISIEHLFKQILLITIVDPYHLPQGEIWHCYNYLSHWAIKTKLHTSNTVPNNVTGLFLVDLQAMQPAKVPEPNQPLKPEYHRLLHVNDLNLLIHQQRKQLLEKGDAAQKGIEGLSRAQASQMFRHMLLAWHVRPNRRSERHEKYGIHPATYGLSAINYYLKKGKLTAGDNAAEADPLDGNTVMLGEIASFHRENIHYQLCSWRIFNRSASGIGIVVPPPFPKDIQVGQLIMIELDTGTDSKQLKAGIIRRMIKRDANTLEVGMQFLPGKIVPISIRPHFHDAEITADFQHGILINRGSKAQQALIAPHGMYQPQREFVLENNHSTRQIISDDIIESTPVFDCFSYH